MYGRLERLDGAFVLDDAIFEFSPSRELLLDAPQTFAVLDGEVVILRTQVRRIRGGALRRLRARDELGDANLKRLRLLRLALRLGDELAVFREQRRSRRVRRILSRVSARAFAAASASSAARARALDSSIHFATAADC